MQRKSVQVAYLSRSILSWLARRNLTCPNCEAASDKIIDRKWLVTTLRECPGCRILYRAPTTSSEDQAVFYQKKYFQGFTTDIPGEEALKALISIQFRGTERDYTKYILLLSNLGIKPGARILEYGCSWGYGAWQLQKAGFEVTAFEISKPRCRYAREKMGVRAVDDPSEIRGPFDAVFSAHVLEHVDKVETALTRQMDHLKPGGWLVGVTPNGSLAYRQKSPKNFHRLWGFVHPQLLDDNFLRARFSGMELWMSSISGEEKNKQLQPADDRSLELSHLELVFAVRTPNPPHH